MQENVRSDLNAQRGHVSLMGFGRFCKFGDVSNALVLEYTYNLIKKKRHTGAYVHRVLRYLKETSPVLEGKAILTCAYVKNDFLIEQEKLVRVLNRMEDTAQRCMAACLLVGVLPSKKNLALTLGDWNTETNSFYSWKLPEWAANFVTQHTDYMRSAGYSNDSLLFTRITNEGEIPYTSKTAKSLLRQYGRRAQLDLAKHADLYYWYQHVPIGATMKYF